VCDLCDEGSGDGSGGDGSGGSGDDSLFGGCYGCDGATPDLPGTDIPGTDPSISSLTSPFDSNFNVIPDPTDALPSDSLAANPDAMAELGSASDLATGLMAGAVVNAVTGGLVGAGLDAALGFEAGGARGLSDLGGIFSSETNAAGGDVWTSDGLINQNDVAGIVNTGMYNGDVNIISGVHGFADGSMDADLGLYEADVARFGDLPGVNIYNFPEMTPGQLNGILNGPGTTIGAFCNSGTCLAPYW
jgi:hypothetical protein